MTKHLEIKTYEFYNIRVMVEINYEKKTISLVEKDNPSPMRENCRGYREVSFQTKIKPYVFINRGLEYMNGWRNVLHAMEYAIDEAQKELEEYLKQKEKENIDLASDILDKASDLVKGQKLRKYPKRK